NSSRWRGLSLDRSRSAPMAPVHCRTSRGWCWRRRQTFRSPWCPTTREAQWQRWPTLWAVAFTALSKACLGLRGPLPSCDLKVIGQMAPQREPEYPSVPTVSETNPGISAIGFMTLAAPAGVPESIQRRLADGLRQALDSPAVKKSYADLGVPIRNYTP